MTIKIGTRKSKLALAQTEMLIKTLKNRFPNVEIETVYISTTGDKTLDKPLTALGGKGVFIKELEMSLLSGETDVAVHSAKDLPTKLQTDLKFPPCCQGAAMAMFLLHAMILKLRMALSSEQAV